MTRNTIIGFLSALFICLTQSWVQAAQPAATTTPATQPAAQTVVEKIITADNTTVAKLENGMTVIIKPVRTAPVVCVQAYVRTGGMHEGKWLGCGISHLLEHLVAQDASHSHEGNGADQAKEASDRVREIGGMSNAYTSMGQTCYYISAAASKTNQCIDLIADWMARPAFTEEDFHREHGVVQRELEMRKDDPSRKMWQAHLANAFADHPVTVPVIGYPTPLASLTYQDVQDYHRIMYVPQNMIFVVVGDVDAQVALQRICKATAGFTQGRAPDLSLPPVKALSSTRRVVQTAQTLKDTMQRISFQTIPLVHEDLYALDVLSYILTQGQSSRLVQSIQRDKKLVTEISSSSWTPEWGKGLFTVSFRSKPENADLAEKAIIEQLKTIVAQGVSEAELARAKRQKVADLVYSQQTAESIASNMAGDYLSTGDVHFSKQYTNRIQAVTAGQIQEMARKYFDLDRMAITRLIPPASKTTATTKPDDTKASADQATVFTLPSGVRVVLQPNDAVGLVAMTFTTKGGVLAETPETNGLGMLTAALSTRGTKSYSAEQIAEFFDSAGGSISGRCGNNTLYWEATVLDDSTDKALEILAEVLYAPKFDAKELDIFRPQLLAAIKRTDESWESQLQKLFRQKFFTDSPYGMLSIGSEDVVSSATPEKLKEYHAKQLLSDKSDAVLAVFGNFDAAAVRKKIEATFVYTPAAAQPKLPATKARKVKAGGELHTLKTTNKVAGVIVAIPGMKVDNLEDRFAIAVLDTIISGYRMPSGWLHEELRGKRLVYVVHAYNWMGLAPGAFVTYAAGQPDNAPQIVEIIKKNLRRASEYKPTQKEIDLAVSSILTAELLGNQSMSSLSMSAALDELYGFGHDFRSKLEEYYRNVTPEDVLRVARKYLSGDYVVIVTTPKPELFETE